LPQLSSSFALDASVNVASASPRQMWDDFWQLEGNFDKALRAAGAFGRLWY